MYTLNLSQSDRKALKDAGMTHVVVLEERSSGSRVLRGKSVSGDTLYGVWHEGEAAADIRWVWERANA